MRHLLLSSPITMAPSSFSNFSKPIKKPSSYPNHSSAATTSSSLHCRHSPVAALDILILILVLFSGTFLISSYLSYLFHSLSLLLPPSLSFSTIFSIILDYPFHYYLSFFLFFILAAFFSGICFNRSRMRCRRVGCKGFRRAMEFDLQMQSEECLRSGDKAVKEIDDLPWKGGHEGNPDYECLRAELRKMAPPNGRAVLLFRERCGCPVAKLEGWGAKCRRRHKKTLALCRGGHHR